MKERAFKDNLIQQYKTLQENEEFFAFAKCFVKISFFHAFFELLLTLFTVDAIIFGLGYTIKKYDLNLDKFLVWFFATTLIACLAVFTFFMIFFFVRLRRVASNHSKYRDEAAVVGKLYQKLCKATMIFGVLSYFFIGIVSAACIDWLGEMVIGLVALDITLIERCMIASLIIGFGIVWLIISITRYYRVDWMNLLKVNDLRMKGMGSDAERVKFRNRRLRAIICNVILEALIVLAMMFAFCMALWNFKGADTTYFGIFLSAFTGLVTLYVKAYLNMEIKTNQILFGKLDNL